MLLRRLVHLSVQLIFHLYHLHRHLRRRFQYHLLCCLVVALRKVSWMITFHFFADIILWADQYASLNLNQSPNKVPYTSSYKFAFQGSYTTANGCSKFGIRLHMNMNLGTFLNQTSFNLLTSLFVAQNLAKQISNKTACCHIKPNIETHIFGKLFVLPMYIGIISV